MKEKDYYHSLYLRARETDSRRFDEYTELLAYYEMKQNELPVNQTEKPWVLNIATPYAADAIGIRIASLFANDYVGELEPLSPSDVENVRKLNDVYHNLWAESNMDKHINDAILNSAILREAYVHFVYDDKFVGGTGRKRKGVVEPYFIDPSSVLIDPQALSLATADYMCVVERITKNQAEYYYEKYQPIDGSSFISQGERGEIYAGKDYDSNQELVLTKRTFYVKEDGKIIKAILIEGQIVYEQELAIDVFPIAQLRWEKRVKSPYGISMMDRLLPLQKSVNAVESATTTAALAFASPSYVVRKDSGINPRAVAALAGAPGVVFSANGDPKSAIVPVSNNNIDPQLVAIGQDNRNEIYRIAGVNDQFLGDFGSAGNTSGGTQEASARSKIIEQRFLSNLEEFVEDCTNIMVQIITKAFRGETFYQRGPKQTNGEYQWGETKIEEDMSELEYTFSINLDIRTPYSKELTKSRLMELFQFERQYESEVKVVTPIDILRNYNVPNIQELVQRYEVLSKRTDEYKAQIIVQWTDTCMKYGIDANVISQGVVEIIAGKETPTVDTILAQIQTQVQQDQAKQLMLEQQQSKQLMNIDAQEQQAQMQAQMKGPTGDEVFSG